MDSQNARRVSVLLSRIKNTRWSNRCPRFGHRKAPCSRLRYQGAAGHGNLAVVMRTMGHGSPSTAMKYQHPELERVRRVLNGTNSNFNSEQGSNGTFYGTVTRQQTR